MFPENVHQAALDVADALLDGPGRTWAKRVFLSDNGSTATEVAIKMGFRKFYVNSGMLASDGETRALDIAENGG